MIKFHDNPIGLPDKVDGSQRHIVDVFGEYSVGQLVNELIKGNDKSGRISVRTSLGGRYIDSATYAGGKIIDNFGSTETAGMPIERYHCFATVGVNRDPNHIDYELSV